MKHFNDAPVFLIGYRGTGKTTVARELAARLGHGWVAIDADDEIERQAGRCVADIFAAEGEEAFRDREAEVLAELCRRRSAAIALGGGAVVREENRQVLRAAGPVVWLAASVETIQQRLAADPTTAARRPNLTQTGGRTEIETLLAAREPFYRECATIRVDTEDRTPAEIAEEILTRLP